MPDRLLLLWDIDGTLLRYGGAREHAAALIEALNEIYGLKLAAAGLGQWFERGQGAFGSDAEDRRELVPVARARAGGWPAERTVVIGDAPGDVECALAGGAIAVALLGHFGREELSAAHLFVERLADLREALDGLPPA